MGRVLKASDRTAVLGTIDPDAYGAGTYTTAWIAMSMCERVLAIVMAGDLGTSATIDAKIEQAKDGSGTDAKDVTGKAITQLTQAGTDSNKQALIDVRADELDVNNKYTHVRLSLTVATATSDAGGLLLGFDGRYEPLRDNDAASVAEIV